MDTVRSMIVDGMEVPINGERNLLEVVRKGGIEIPTFCYHSELSIYGACRLCIVEVEGRGIVASCSTLPEAGLKVHTSTSEIRKMRKVALELLLAGHEQECTTCYKNTVCKLQKLSKNFGIEKVRFRHVSKNVLPDFSSPSITRDPNKCILCGDCVRMCAEVQGIGAIDFAHRGHKACVMPAFGKDLAQVECVNCGQCARVCPTGALTPRSEVAEVWRAVHDPKKKVVVQIAPAVRVALGEEFGLAPGSLATGKMVSAVKMMGFDEVYDTCFAADLTVVEEAEEFLKKVRGGAVLPQFTSCCPAWIKFAEQYYPELFKNLSTCRSPQQMFGSVAKEVLVKKSGVARKDLVVVSVMPCTAKKFEAKRPEFMTGGNPDVDHVLTTQELAQMIRERGICFDQLKSQEFDRPFGETTGAGVIFGNSGGVTEAVLRYAVEKVTGQSLLNIEFQEVRGEEGLREASINLNGKMFHLAVVHGLANARRVCEQVKAGNSRYHLIEVMACPGGCVGGAGQPVVVSGETRRKRSRGLYDADKMMKAHKSQENREIIKLYAEHLGEAGSEKAHHLLHTRYQSRKRFTSQGLPLIKGGLTERVNVEVCVGTGCHTRGSEDILHGLAKYVAEEDLKDLVGIKGTFCFEKCGKGPNVRIGDKIYSGCSLQSVKEVLERTLSETLPVKNSK
jgi:NADH-quinone oxidoreductase subunit G